MAISERQMLNIFKRDLKASEPNKSGWDDQILRWVKEYNGEPYGNERKGKASVVSRDIKKAAVWQHALIIDPFVSNDEIIKAVPQNSSSVQTARQAEMLLNYQFCRDFDRYNFVSNSFKVLQREGTVVARVSWEFEEEEQLIEEPVYGMVPITDPVKYQQAVQMGKMPFERKVIDVALVPQMITIVNRPRVELVRNSMLWVDPTAENNISDAKFVIYKFRSSLSDLRKDGKYKNLDNIIIDGSPIIDIDSPYYKDETFTFEDKPRQELEVIEYWGYFDMNEDGIAEPMVCTWVGDTIIRMEENPYPDGKPPFVSCALDSEPFSVYGVALGDTISTDQKIKTGIKRAILDTLDASTNGQKGVKKGTLDIVNKRKFERGDDFEYLGSNQDFWEGKFNTIPTDVLNFYNIVDADIQSLSGVRPFGPGNGSSHIDNPRSGVNAQMDASAKREVDVSRNYKENFLVPILRKWYSMDTEWMEEDQIIRVTDDEFIAIKPDDLKGHIDIVMNVSTQEVNAEKSNNLTFMLQTMAQSLPFELTKILLAEQARLKDMPDLAKKINEFEPQPDPLVQKQKELELAKIQSEVNERNSRVYENQVDSRLKAAKAAYEEAKAREAHSKADINDLDFVRKQEGIDHQEKVTEEAQRSNNRRKEAVEKAGLGYIEKQALEDGKSKEKPSRG